MKDSVVPSSVSFSVNNQATDDYSRLTWSHDDNNDNGTIEGMCARLIATKLAMSPNDYNNNSNNTLDKDPFSQTYKPELSTLLHLLTTTTTTTDDTHNDASFPSLEEEDHQELIRLKLQLALHNQMLDSMSAKWNASRIENEALKAENEYLTEELVLARDALDVIVEHHGHKHTHPEPQVQVQKQKHVEIQQQQQKPVKHRRQTTKMPIPMDATSHQYHRRRRRRRRRSNVQMSSCPMIMHVCEWVPMQPEVPSNLTSN